MFLKHSLSLSGAFPRLNEKEEVGNKKKERERERAFFFSFFFFSGRAEGGVTYAARFKSPKRRAFFVSGDSERAFDFLNRPSI